MTVLSVTDIAIYATLSNLDVKINNAIVQYDIAYIKCAVSCPRIIVVYILLLFCY